MVPVGSLLQWEAHINVWLQQVSWLAPAMKTLSFLGTEEFFVLLVPLVYWCINKDAGIDLALLLFSVNGVNGLLKLAFHAPRPYWISLAVQPLATETSYGLPSGHAAIAASCWPLLARRIRGRRAIWASVVVILLISLSRLFLGVHFLTDILGGWIVGTGMLVLYETAGRAFIRRFRSLRPGAGVAQATIFPAALLLATWGVQSAISRIQDPTYARWAMLSSLPRGYATWGAFITAGARDWSGFVSTAGIMWGCFLGLGLQQRHMVFSAQGSFTTKAERFLLGMAGILLFWRVFALFLPSGNGFAAQAGRFLRYALTGFWTVYLAPLVFLKTGLAHRESVAPNVKGVSVDYSTTGRS